MMLQMLQVNTQNNQQKVLRHMYRLAPYQPLIGDSRMALVRWLIEQTDREEETEELKEEQVRQSLYHLEKKRYIKKVHLKDGGIQFEFTKLGKAYTQKREIKDLRFTPPKKWDGRWRFVMFDVPQKYNYTRDILRDKLKRLGFFRAQQSVWVFPYDIGEEIDFLLEFLRLEDCVLQFTGEVKNDKGLLEHFREKNFKL